MWRPSVMPSASTVPSWIWRSLPERPVVIPFEPEKLEIIREPCHFYQLVKDKCSTSSKRITISCLYLGTGEQEQSLVNVMKKKIAQTPNINVTLLFDYTRSTRVNKEGKSSVDILKQLIPEAHLNDVKTRDHVSINLFLSPSFSSPFFKHIILPQPKINEIVNLQHIKCFIFDNDVIISGANLSDQYFVDRVDRYFWFKNSPALCNFLDDLVKTVSSFSLQMAPNGSFDVHEDWHYHPLMWRTKRNFVNEARNRVHDCYDRHQTNHKENPSTTFLVPLLQMRPFKINDDVSFTTKLFNNIQANSIVNLASGYFNLTTRYKKALLTLQKKSNVTCNLLMASEEVNSFYKAPGLMKFIPSFYTHMSRVFLRQVLSSSKDGKNQINLWTFFKPKWTFHSKGLWISHDNWMITTIGSSNFGYRSALKDLELQVAIVTDDKQLQDSFREECNLLWSHGMPLKKEDDLPSVPRWLAFVSPFIKKFF